MPSQVYLFEPSSANANDKPLVQILREAEQARSRESAKYLGDAFRRVAGYFRAKKTAATSASTHPAEDTRLAA